jgi:hypothetical protein
VNEKSVFYIVFAHGSLFAHGAKTMYYKEYHGEQVSNTGEGGGINRITRPSLSGRGPNWSRIGNASFYEYPKP